MKIFKKFKKISIYNFYKLSGIGINFIHCELHEYIES